MSRSVRAQVFHRARSPHFRWTFGYLSPIGCITSVMLPSPCVGSSQVANLFPSNEFRTPADSAVQHKLLSKTTTALFLVQSTLLE
jgi:hypothetical protein